MRRTTTRGWAACGAAALLLAGCGGGSSATDVPAAPAASTAGASATTSADAAGTPSDLPSESGMPPIETSGAATPGAKGDKPITVNKSATSTAMGESWTVLQVVRHFPVPARYPLLKDGELVAVKVKAVGSTKFYSVISGSSFRLVADGEVGTDKSSIMGTDLEKAGYKPVLPDVHHGETKTGWLIFSLDKRSAAKLTFRYTQLAANTSKGPIPAKNIDTVIVG